MIPREMSRAVAQPAQHAKSYELVITESYTLTVVKTE
jgi:hypothetical protein